jgi:hypothetical protein
MGYTHEPKLFIHTCLICVEIKTLYGGVNEIQLLRNSLKKFPEYPSWFAFITPHFRFSIPITPPIRSHDAIR